MKLRNLLKVLLSTFTFIGMAVGQVPGPVTALPGTPTTLALYSYNQYGYPVLGPSNLTDNGTLLLYKGQPIGGGSLPSVQVEHVFASAGSFNFNHALSDEYPLYSCFSLSGASAYTATPVDANNMQITVSAPATILCAFQATAGIRPDFQFTVTPATSTYTPTMGGTQTPTFAIAQTVVGGYSGTATYSTTGLAAGMSSSYSPTTINGAGSSTLSVSFPATQASGLTTFNASATDGTLTHTSPIALTISNINSGLLDGWQMNEGSGTAFNDATANANNQTFSAGIGSWGTVAGFPGSSFTFNATGFATGSNNTLTNFDGTTPFSVSVWVKFTTVSAVQTLVGTLDPTNGAIGWELFNVGGGSTSPVSFYLINTFGTNYIQVNAGGVSAGTIYYIAATYDGSRTAAGVSIYINGVHQTSTVIKDALTASIANTKNVSIGGRSGGGQLSSATEGYVRIYNRVLSPSDITSYYAAGPR